MTIENLVPALEGAISIYDLPTAEHSVRVMSLAITLGRHVGLQDREIETLAWAGSLHDLGKLAVPHDVLHKRGRLDEFDWAQIRRHPAAGADFLMTARPDLLDVADAIRDHHERWDGSGYPNGRAGSDISVWGRVVAVADAFDAMTANRIYRERRLTSSAVLDELRRGRGSQFDPDLADGLVDLVRAGSVNPSSPPELHTDN